MWQALRRCFSPGSRFLFCLAILFTLLWVRGEAQGATQAHPGGLALHLRVGELALPPATRQERSLETADTAGLRLVQFPGPIQDAWYQAMLANGLEVVTYVPDHGYLVWGSGRDVRDLAADVPLYAAGEYLPGYALHPQFSQDTSAPAEQDVIVQFYRHAQIEQVVAKAAATGEWLYPAQDFLVYRVLRLRVPGERLPWLAALPGVVSVEPLRRNQMLDEVQGQIMAGNLNAAGSQPAGPGYLAWLQSLGFSTNPVDYPIIDISDDGIDNGASLPNHADFYRLGNKLNLDRLAYNVNWTVDETADGWGGHGSLNAAIAAGYNDQAGFPFVDADGYHLGLGVNPFGRVAGSKVFNNLGNWDLPGNDYQALVAQAYALGARISSNSWGDPELAGDYALDDQTYDALVRDALAAQPGNQQMIVLFAAGNLGPGANTTTSPGNAKNVITVGSAENFRPAWTDGCYVPPAGADNAQDISNFSSRGPTDDSRVKPDLVAPGSHIQAAASQVTGYNGIGVCDRYYPDGQTLYAASSGTSHAAPAAAGAAALVYRYYQARFGGLPPSPAMVKAYLINAARYLNGTGANDHLPSNSQGFGEVFLGRALDGAARILEDQTHVFTATNELYQMSGVVADPDLPLRVTLAWSDAPGPTMAAAYVNNLDLEVEVGGQTYKGNVFAGQYSAPGGAADSRNNVESVYLPAGQDGALTVRVRAANLAGDGLPGNGDPTDQDFALVVYNARGRVGYFRGTVMQAATGESLPGAMVRASGAVHSYQAVADALGGYTLTVPLGDYTLTAWKYGFAAQAAPGLALQEEQTITQNFVLTPSQVYSLSGCVRDQVTTQGLDSVLTLSGLSGEVVTQTITTQAQPCYALHLAGGEYNLRVESLLHETGETALVLEAHRTQDFALPPTTTDGLLHGLVTDQRSGLPLSGASIVAQPGGRSAFSGGDGMYNLLLPAGTYTLSVMAPFHAAYIQTGVNLPQSCPAELNAALPAPFLAFTPGGTFTVEQGLGSQGYVLLNLQNLGPGDLKYSLYESTGQPPSLGPDSYGYVMLDSRTHGEVQFHWLDASDGQNIVLFDDDEANISLPFPFTLYGKTSTQLRVGNNGAVLFGAAAGNVPSLNGDLGNAAVDDFVAPFWDDLDGGIGEVTYQTFGTAPQRRFVIAWISRPHYPSLGAATFEIVFYEDSQALKFQYLDVVFGQSDIDLGASATVGVRGSGAQYLQASTNTAALVDHLALCFQPPGALPCDPVDYAWLDVSPAVGEAAAGVTQAITVSLDARLVEEIGLYPAVLRLASNDPARQPFWDLPLNWWVRQRMYLARILKGYFELFPGDFFGK